MIMSRNSLSKYDELRKGDSIVSNNGEWTAIFQHDSNFVIYTHGNPTWAADTYGLDVFRLVLQPDCNLVMYNKFGIARWTTNTSRPECCCNKNTCRLQLTDEGKLELYREAELLWSSTNSKGYK